MKMQRNSATLAVAITAVAIAVLGGDDFQRARAATEVQRVAVAPSRGSRAISLRDRLVVGLQARLKPEVAFVELVTARVRAGQLPQRLVDETFFWARQRAKEGRSGRMRRPIIFFQPAMTARAKRIGVAL
jgi:hypothetical protein